MQKGSKLKSVLGAIIALLLCVSSVNASEEARLAREISKLKKEYKVAVKKASFYEHQVFNRQFSKKGGADTKRLRRKVAQWKLKSHEIYTAIEHLESQLAEEA